MYSQRDQVIMLLCMDIKSDDLNEAKPLSFSEWSKLASILMEKNQAPEILLNMTDEDLLVFLNQNNEDFLRYKSLISRGNKLSNELLTLDDIGIKVVTRANDHYPKILKSKLKNNCPPLWFYAGNIEILDKKGISIVGSRTIDEKDVLITAKMAEKIVNEDYALISGGAKGVDTESELAALDVGGKVVSIISDSLVGKIKKKEIRQNIVAGNILIMSPYGYDSHFTVGTAMGRNKYIYALSEKAIVIKSSLEKGGTWAGVEEAAKKNLTDIILIEGSKKTSGNSVLAEMYKLKVLRKSDVLDSQKSFTDLMTEFEASKEIIKYITKEIDGKKVKFEKLELDLFDQKKE
jgi:DNA processing protein